MNDELFPDAIVEVDACRLNESVRAAIREKVIVDCEFTIKIDGRVAARLTCLPPDKELLGWGFLVGGGWIDSVEDVRSFDLKGNILTVALKVPRESGLSAVLAGCGNDVVFSAGGGAEARPSVHKNPILCSPVFSGDIFKIMNEFQKADELHKVTGATHSAGLGQGDKLLFAIPDVGRHNALQKVLGKVFLENIPVDDKIIFTTGRVSSEMVTACAALSIPVIVSKSAPLLSAIYRAGERGVTVAGFVRGKRLTCFTFPERVQLSRQIS